MLIYVKCKTSFGSCQSSFDPPVLKPRWGKKALRRKRLNVWASLSLPTEPVLAEKSEQQRCRTGRWRRWRDAWTRRLVFSASANAVAAQTYPQWSKPTWMEHMEHRIGPPNPKVLIHEAIIYCIPAVNHSWNRYQLIYFSSFYQTKLLWKAPLRAV